VYECVCVRVCVRACVRACVCMDVYIYRQAQTKHLRTWEDAQREYFRFRTDFEDAKKQVGVLKTQPFRAICYSQYIWIVCVFVCASERARESERQKETEKQRNKDAERNKGPR
jgi:hypothetical protein